jgi:hypothetical protein
MATIAVLNTREAYRTGLRSKGVTTPNGKNAQLGIFTGCYSPPQSLPSRKTQKPQLDASLIGLCRRPSFE